VTAAQGPVGSGAVDLHLPPVPVTALAAAADGATRDARDVTVSEAAYDSRRVRPGAVFFCIPGAIVVDHWLPLRAPQVLVPSVREAMGPMSAELFGRPAEDLTMLGVTGTNGKTTTTYLLEAILRQAGRRPAAIGTTGARVEGAVIPMERTTPEAPDLHRLLATLRAMGVGAVAMEVSSHALAFARVGGIRFDVAAFTNLSHDHLDLHGTMTSYFAAKASLFTAARARFGVVNADDRWGQRLLGEASIPIRTYGMTNPADRYAIDVEVGVDGSSFAIGAQPFRTPMLGMVNVSNALCAVTVAELAGIPPTVAAAGIERAPIVPGRLERIDAGQPFLVVVDYAHTPDSIELVLRGARPLATGRTIIVFGCGGDRDRAKRPRMGEVATTEADLSVITTDNPRDEDPAAIIDAIVVGAREGGGEFVVEPDRRAAIRVAFDAARPGDIVIIAGKGHEIVQEVGAEALPFDDREVAREELATIGGAA
jgi:UDP-N-acetylmuramoyl-L-alanyl-D-glutamate--2,6-diaminopimelate ligase